MSKIWKIAFVSFLLLTFSCRKESINENNANTSAPINFRDNKVGTYNCIRYNEHQNISMPSPVFDTSYYNLTVTMDNNSSNGLFVFSDLFYFDQNGFVDTVYGGPYTRVIITLRNDSVYYYKYAAGSGGYSKLTMIGAK